MSPNILIALKQNKILDMASCSTFISFLPHVSEFMDLIQD